MEIVVVIDIIIMEHNSVILFVNTKRQLDLIVLIQ